MKKITTLLAALALLLAACGGGNSFSHTYAGSSWLTTPSGDAFVIHNESRDGEAAFQVTALVDDSIGGSWMAPAGAYVNALAIFERSILVSINVADGVRDYYMIDQQGDGTKVVADSDTLKAALAALLYDRPYRFQTPFDGGVVISSNLRPDLRNDELPDLYLLGADLSIRPIEIEGASFYFGVSFVADGDGLYAVLPESSAPDGSRIDGSLIRLDESLTTVSTMSLRASYEVERDRLLQNGSSASARFPEVRDCQEALLIAVLNGLGMGWDEQSKYCYVAGTNTYLLALDGEGATELVMLNSEGDLTPVENLGLEAWPLGAWENEDADLKIAVVDSALYLVNQTGNLLRVVDGVATPMSEGTQGVGGIVELRVVNDTLWIGKKVGNLYEYRVFKTSQE